MADWNGLTTSTSYLTTPAQIVAMATDAAQMFNSSPTNPPNNIIRFNRSTNIFEEWGGSSWGAKVIGITGGGTGGTDAASGRSALGIGTMGTQDNSSVNITGGTISGVTMAASVITSGVIGLARGGTGVSLSLGSLGQVMYSDGSNIAFADGDQIAKLNASNLTSGTVPSARLANAALIAGTNVFTGQNVFGPSPDTIATYPTISGAIPYLHFYENDQTTNAKFTTLAVQNGIFVIQTRNDDLSFATQPLSITRAGVMTANGSGLTALNASNLSTGTVGTARLGSGTANSTTYLRGDGVWASISAPDGIPSGLVAIFQTSCPTGWTRVSAFDSKFLRGASSYGATGGSDVHRHGQSGTTSNDGAHTHTFSGTTNDPSTLSASGGTPFGSSGPSHTHDYSGTTSSDGAHTHSVTNDTDDANGLPPYIDVVFCSKN